MDIPAAPLRGWIDAVIGWMHQHLDFVFDPLTDGLDGAKEGIQWLLVALPPYAMIALAVVALGLARRWSRMVIVAACLLLIWNQGLWNEAMETIALVLVAGGIALAVGIPVGIAMSESRAAEAAITPVLDYMQTTPAFVYLIPAVMLFSIGDVPGIVATATFALPPPARAVNLGIRQIDPQIIEAGRAFGSSRWDLLTKLKLPLALPYIRYGVNQCIMMSLAMVIITSLIGAGGLGRLVVEALSQFKLVQGIESGVAVVLVAVVLDRLSGTSTGSDHG